MILRNAAVRHGRRALASPIPRSALRQLSSESAPTESAVATPPPNAQLPIDQVKDNVPFMVSKQKKMSKAKETIMTLGADSTPTHQGLSWTRPHKIGNSEELTPKEQWEKFRKIRTNTKKLGSVVERQYKPTDLVNNPPSPQDVTLELLMASQTHMGHHTSLWNPANSRYIYGVREGIHIISLETTAAHLRRAARVVEEVARCGGLILFVGTRKGQMEIVTKASELAGACHVFTKWTPGAITNRDVILKTAATKVVNETDQPLEDFDLYSATARPLMPDLVVCLNPKENYTLLYECGLKNIPTIGVIDTDADPTWVTYTIPANDDSLRSIGVIAGVLGRAGERGQQLRKQVSQDEATIPWETSPSLKDFMNNQKRNARKEQKEVMNRTQHNVQGFNEEEQHLLQSQYAKTELDTSEAAMLEVLGEAAAVEELSEAAASTSNLGDIEAQLASVKAKTEEVETELKGLNN